MNRYQIMEAFLIDIADLLKENPNTVFSFEELYKIVYSKLTRIGISDYETDLSKNGNNAFSRLQNYFEGSRNISTYIDPKNNYFIQLENRPTEHNEKMETIKLYFPQKAISLERSARELFDFLSTANISHISRIGKNERNNNIMVQLNNWNDVNTVLNFAKGNKIIQYGALDSNPFMYSEDNIGITTSRGNSYDAIVSSLITSYLNNRLLNNDLDSVSLLDFIKYTRSYYNHHFVDYNDIGEAIADFNLSGCEISSIENNKKIVNVGNVVNLFIRCLEPHFNLDSFKEIYYDYSNDGKIIGMANALGIKRNSGDFVTGSNYVGSIDTILLDAVKTFEDKYKINDEQALKIINNYLEDFNSHKITRDNDIRGKMIKSDFANKMNRLLSITNQDLKEYYNVKKQSRAIRVLRDAIYETYNKYEDIYVLDSEELQVDGKTRAQFALKELIYNNNSLGFTRRNNARLNLLNYGDIEVAIDEVEHTLETQLDLKDENALREACGKYVQYVIDDRLEIKGQERVLR